MSDPFSSSGFTRPGRDAESFRDECGIAWICEPKVRVLLVEDILPNLARLVSDGELPPGAEQVKRSLYRRVLRWERRGIDFYLKAHELKRAPRRWGQKLRGSRGVNEWHMTLALRELGLATPRPLAAGEIQAGLGVARSYYLCEAVPESRTLTGALVTERDAVLRRRWLESVGRGLGSLHRARLHHRDLHANNLLVSGEDPDPRWIDLHSLWRVPFLGRAARLKTLAKLLSSLDEEIEAHEAKCLVEAYLAQAQLHGSIQSWLDPALRRGAKLQAAQLVSRTRRCMTGGSKVARRKSVRGRSWYRRDEVDAETPWNWLDGCVAARGESLLKHEEGRVRVARLADPRGGEVVAKLYEDGGWRAPWRVRFGYGRARRAWIATHGLLQRRFDVAAPLALVECADGRELWVCRFLENTQSLERFAARFDLRGSERRAWVDELAAYLGRLHARGGHHRDLSAKNVLLRREGVRWRFWCVDLEDLELGVQPRGDALVRALGQLNDVPLPAIGLRDRLRFWRGYLRARGEGATIVARRAHRDSLPRIDAWTRARVQRREARWRAEGREVGASAYFETPLEKVLG